MGLDAFVFCDCYEKDGLRCDPPAGIELQVAPTGELTCITTNEAEWFAFSAWKTAKACVHQNMVLVHHRLGNTADIAALRSELQNWPKQFPILLRNVLYSSTHTCDWIPLDRMEQLTEELKGLVPEPAGGAISDTLRLFKIKMAELVIAAKFTGKPICF